MITVELLRKKFTYYRKATGLRGSLHNFSTGITDQGGSPDISFSVEEWK